MKPDKNLSKKALLTSRYKYPLMFKENIRLFVPSPDVELIDLFNCKNNLNYTDCKEHFGGFKFFYWLKSLLADSYFCKKM